MKILKGLLCEFVLGHNWHPYLYTAGFYLRECARCGARREYR